MNSAEHLANVVASFEANGDVPLAVLRDWWATRVLDEWRKISRATRSWSMSDEPDPSCDLCVLTDNTREVRIVRPFAGTSPAAARVAAAEFVARENPKLLERV